MLQMNARFRQLEAFVRVTIGCLEPCNRRAALISRPRAVVVILSLSRA
jgi:hypothetical protein